MREIRELQELAKKGYGKVVIKDNDYNEIDSLSNDKNIIVKYEILNAKNNVLKFFNNEKEAYDYYKKGILKGWKWSLYIYEHKIQPRKTPEWWECAGYFQNPDNVHWGSLDDR